MPSEFKICPRCVTRVPVDAAECPQCGMVYRSGRVRPTTEPTQHQAPAVYQPSQRPDVIQMLPGTHSTSLAVLLSICPGWWLGALCNRQMLKGVVILAVQAGLSYLAALDPSSSGGFFGLAIWIVGIIDTVAIGKRLYRGEPVGQWQFF